MKKLRFIGVIALLLAAAGYAQPVTYTTGGFVIHTNFVSGQIYVNNYKRIVTVSCTVTNVQAAAAGTTRFDLWVFQQSGAANRNGTTNSCGAQVLGTSLATTNNCGVLSAQVPVGFAWAFTNQSAGAGNAAGPRDGQIFVPP